MVPGQGPEAGPGRQGVQDAPVAVEEALREDAQFRTGRCGLRPFLVHVGEVGGYVQAHEPGQMDLHVALPFLPPP